MSDMSQTVNIMTMMKRLEAATSRLEDLIILQEGRGGDSKAIEGSAPATGTAAAQAPASKANKEEVKEPESITQFKDFLDTKVADFVKLSESINPVVAEAARTFQDAFKQELRLLRIATSTKKPAPTDPAFAALLKPIGEKLQKINELREANRQSKFYNHLSSIAESSPALAWVQLDLPVPYIGELKDAGEFYTNRVLKEFKSVDPVHSEWVKTWKGLFADLQAYVKKYHTTGISWNPRGGKIADAKDVDEPDQSAAPTAPAEKTPSAAPAVSSGGPPPPPPPPPPPADIYDDKPSSAPSSGSGMGAVFEQLNQGEGITSSLKKVDKSQMTHKNPELRKSGSVGSASSTKKPSPPLPKKPASLSNKKPPVKELVDTKWIIQNFEDEHELSIDGTMEQGVFIERCNNCTIKINGKVSAITISNCNKIGVLVDTLVSGVDIIKSTKVGLQVTGVLPTLTLDQTHEANVYLSKESLDVKIYTSQTSSLNINIPGKEEGDYNELALPEQVEHKIVDGKLQSEIVVHAG